MKTVYHIFIDVELKDVCMQMIEYILHNQNLRDYINNAKDILFMYEENNYQKNIANITVPEYSKIKFFDDNYLHYQKIGIKNVYKCGFVIVAGGIGERLNSSETKLALPINQISDYSYLKLYIRTLLSYQQITGKELFICIMTSNATDWKIRHYLSENNYFGMPISNIFLIKQNNVPTLIGNQCNLCYSKGKIIDKPHGHGDVHKLLLNVYHNF